MLTQLWAAFYKLKSIDVDVYHGLDRDVQEKLDTVFEIIDGVSVYNRLALEGHARAQCRLNSLD